jgi:hypothetical protein
MAKMRGHLGGFQTLIGLGDKLLRFIGGNQVRWIEALGMVSFTVGWLGYGK